MNTKKVFLAGMSALAMTLSPVASSVAPLVTPVFAKSPAAPATMATPNGVADFVKGMRQSLSKEIRVKHW